MSESVCHVCNIPHRDLTQMRTGLDSTLPICHMCLRYMSNIEDSIAKRDHVAIEMPARLQEYDEAIEWMKFVKSCLNADYSHTPTTCGLIWRTWQRLRLGRAKRMFERHRFLPDFIAYQARVISPV